MGDGGFDVVIKLKPEELGTTRDCVRFTVRRGTRLPTDPPSRPAIASPHAPRLSEKSLHPSNCASWVRGSTRTS